MQNPKSKLVDEIHKTLDQLADTYLGQHTRELKTRNDRLAAYYIERKSPSLHYSWGFFEYYFKRRDHGTSNN